MKTQNFAHLILMLTNGELYSSPTVKLFHDPLKANAFFTEAVGNEFINRNDCTKYIKNSGRFIDNIGSERHSLTFQELIGGDTDDNTAVHKIVLKPNKFYVLNITCNYVEEFTIKAFKTMNEAKKHFAELISKTEWNNEPEQEETTFFGEGDDESKYFCIIDTTQEDKNIYFIFGETPCIDIDNMTESEFLKKYGKEGDESCHPFKYNKEVTTAIELLDAMNGSFDYAIISEKLYNKLA